MTLQQQIGNCFMVGFQGTTAPSYLLEWLAEGRVGGVILFGRNIESPSQVAALTRSLHAAAMYPILVSIDQEGGTVARLRGVFTESPGAMALSNTDNPEHAFTAYATLGQEMRELGINWNYAPVVDLLLNRENPTVGTRSFGMTAERVGRFARAAVRGLQQSHVAACAKHFPGLGNTPIDTHVALATLDTPLEHLIAHDLLPYREVIAQGVDSIMTTHTRFLALDSQHPATLSPVIVRRLLREELGYQGVVTTDCLEMKAIADHYGAGESAIMALLGDVDIVLFSHTRDTQQVAIEAVTDAVKGGRVSQARLDTANQRRAHLVEQVAIGSISDAQVHNVQRQQTMITIAEQALSLLKGAAPEMVFDDQVVFVEFASALESEVMEEGGSTGIRTLLDTLDMQPRYIGLKPYGEDSRVDEALMLAQQAKVTIIATRNAHLLPEQADRARRIAEAAHSVVHVCLRNPFDAGIIEADTVLASCGDSQPQLEAVLRALRGDVDIRAGLRAENR